MLASCSTSLWKLHGPFPTNTFVLPSYSPVEFCLPFFVRCPLLQVPVTKSIANTLFSAFGSPTHPHELSSIHGLLCFYSRFFRQTGVNMCSGVIPLRMHQIYRLCISCLHSMSDVQLCRARAMNCRGSAKYQCSGIQDLGGAKQVAGFMQILDIVK